MPTCNKTAAAATATTHKNVAGADDHASEAAKMRRTREQAYFNSYNFDAIEVLPYDDDDDDDDEGDDDDDEEDDNGKNKESNKKQFKRPKKGHIPASQHFYRGATKTNMKSTIPSPATHLKPQGVAGAIPLASSLSSLSLSTSAQSRSSSNLSGSGHESGANGELKFSYLQRIGNFFSHPASVAGRKNTADIVLRPPATMANATGGVGGSEIATGIGNAKTSEATKVVGENFLLPRAILKYQSSPGAVVNAISMPPNGAPPAPPPIQSSSSSSTTTTSLTTSATGTATATTISTNAITVATPTTTTSSSNGTAVITIPAATAATKTKTNSSDITKLKIGKSTNVGGNNNDKKTINGGIPGANEKQKRRGGHTVLPLDEQQQRAHSHQSHYSTEKSAAGSSGYYSSNVCSTYSMEDHIYCEPIVDIVMQANVVGGGQKGGNTGRDHRDRQPMTHLPANTGKAANIKMDLMGIVDNTKRVATTITDDGSCRADKNPYCTSTILDDGQKFRDNLRILETSIENLDRHLKRFPTFSSQEKIANFVQSHHAYLHNLPTIVEGCTPPSAGGAPPVVVATMAIPHWPLNATGAVEQDDSLHDIDLDSFLLVNERKNLGGTTVGLVDPTGKRRKSSRNSGVGGGIDNPTFLTDELEENNVKCSKYINSCPEDAYRVESDIVARGGQQAMSSSTPSDHQSLSGAHFVASKRYEDQLHFQNTRELLEDVRDKIRMLSSRSGSVAELASRRSSSSGCGSGGADATDGGAVGGVQGLEGEQEDLPKELEGMIRTLKCELESYLDRMNRHSELEIRQLCSGLVKHHNIVRMQKAFERRRSTASMTGLSMIASALAGEIEDPGSGGGGVGVGDDGANQATYEVIRGDGALVPFSGVPLSIRQRLNSIRCASDPNFKMKRKSLADIFPVHPLTSAMDQITPPPSPPLTAPPPPPPLLLSARQQTQLQRNLSFHQPILNQLDPKDSGLTGSGVGPSGSGSGTIAKDGDSRGSGSGGDKDSILEWHRKKPSIWEMYYGTNRLNQALLGKRASNNATNNNHNGNHLTGSQTTMSYPSSRPESDFTLDLPRAEQLRIKMDKEKKFRRRCRYITTFLSLVFFLLTVMVVSLVLTRGKRMFGSMI